MVVAVVLLVGIGYVLWRGYEECTDLYSPEVQRAAVGRARPRGAQGCRLPWSEEERGEKYWVPVAERDAGDGWDRQAQALLGGAPFWPSAPTGARGTRVARRTSLTLAGDAVAG